MRFPSNKIQNLIELALILKMDNFNPESGYKPIHNRLLGQDRMILFSIVHSINTNIGTSIYEPIAKELASAHFDIVKNQVKLSGEYTEDAQREISKIMGELSLGASTPEHRTELERIRSKCKSGSVVRKGMTNVDLFLKRSNEYYYIDIKTAKPNQDGAKGFKQTALEWMATHLFEHPDSNITPIIGIPYNPDHPKPYGRWTMKKYFDVSESTQLMVGKEFWNFLAGGEDIYDQLLDCFEIVGKKMRPEIDKFLTSAVKSHPQRSKF